jgi:hypothetical protein
VSRLCDSCGEPFETKRPNARWCSARCNKRGQRGHVVDLSAKAEAPPAAAAVSVAVLAELVAAGRESSSLGVQALALAGRIDAGRDTGAAIASLSRELRATVEAALKGVAAKADGLDDLARRREKKAAGA